MEVGAISSANSFSFYRILLGPLALLMLSCGDFEVLHGRTGAATFGWNVALFRTEYRDILLV